MRVGERVDLITISTSILSRLWPPRFFAGLLLQFQIHRLAHHRTGLASSQSTGTHPPLSLMAEDPPPSLPLSLSMRPPPVLSCVSCTSPHT